MKKILSALLILITTVLFTPTNAFATTTIAAANDATTNIRAASIADDVNFSDNALLTMPGNFSINTAADPGAATEVVATAVTATTSANGTITYTALHTGAASIFGRVGVLAPFREIVAINLNGTGSLTLYGDALIDNGVNMGANSTLILIDGVELGATASSISNTTTNQGTLVLGSGSSVTGTVGSTGVGLNTITAIRGNASIGAATKASNFSVATNTLAITGTLAIPAAGSLSSTTTSGTTFGKLTSTGNATVTAGATVAMTVSGYIPNGATLKVVDGTGGVGIGATTVTSTSPNVTFSASSGGEDLTLTATRTATAATAGNNTAVATAINGTGTPTGDFATVLGQLDSLTTVLAVDAAYAQLDPIANAGNTAATFTAMNESLATIVNHLTDVRTNNGLVENSGVSTGDFWKDNGWWVKGFGSYADQDLRDGVEGYNASLWGVSSGIDGIVAENTRLGFAGGYGATNVDNDGIGAGGTDIDSYQGTVYWGYDDPSPWYGTAGFSFAWNDYEGSRDINFGSISRTAKADYDGQQYTGFGDLGYVIKQNEFNVTPMASLTYSHLFLDSYTETEAGDLSLRVDGQDYDLLQSGLGIKIDRPIVNNSGTWTPEIHFKWLHDFIGDEVATNATFTGGGSSFSTRGADPAQHSFNLGAGLTFYSKGNVSITGTYDFELKDDYISHTGQGVLRVTF